MTAEDVARRKGGGLINMGRSAEFNFHDLDVLGIGPVARQASAVFDSYWNSDWVMPVSALKLSVTRAENGTRAGPRSSRARSSGLTRP